MACDNSTPDGNLSPTPSNPNGGDQAISIDDGPTGAPWMSPDISLNGSDIAIPGNSSLVDIRVHRGNAGLPPGANKVIVEVFACKPSLNWDPLTAFKIGSKTLSVSGASVELPVNGIKWLSQVPDDPSNPAGPPKTLTWVASASQADPDGHCCLIARCFPSVLTPDESCFHTFGDKHVAQRNVKIVQTIAGEPFFRTEIRTVNTNYDKPENVTLLVEADIAPSRRIVEILTPSLRAIKGFRRISQRPPRSFALQLKDFPDAKIRDHSNCGRLIRLIRQLRGDPRQCSYEANIVMKEGQSTTFTIQGDLRGGSSGDANIFHLSHVNAKGRMVGGLTLAVVTL